MYQERDFKGRTVSDNSKSRRNKICVRHRVHYRRNSFDQFRYIPPDLPCNISRSNCEIGQRKKENSFPGPDIGKSRYLCSKIVSFFFFSSSSVCLFLLDFCCFSIFFFFFTFRDGLTNSTVSRYNAQMFGLFLTFQKRLRDWRAAIC